MAFPNPTALLLLSAMSGPVAEQAREFERALGNVILSPRESWPSKEVMVEVFRCWLRVEEARALEAMLAPFRGSVEFVGDPNAPADADWEGEE